MTCKSLKEEAISEENTKVPERSQRSETEERVSLLTDGCIRSHAGSAFYENIVNLYFLLELKLPKDK